MDVTQHRRVLAIIGTAGRDKNYPMTKKLWECMLSDIRQRVSPDDILVSGGAAWADHLAVVMYLENNVAGLRLHLPAPWNNKKFDGYYGTSGGAANYYHKKFSSIVEINSLEQIQEAINKGAEITIEPMANGYGAMFARNKKVADESTSMLAYTFGEGNVPDDGGTKVTWNMSKITDKTHVPLGAFC
jgi:hypothetical protein